MITFEQIKNSNPLLIIYPGGSGGEFTANIISQASKSFNKLSNKRNENTNRIEVISPLNFQHTWKDLNNPETWVTPDFPHTDDNLRYVLRLHPDTDIVNHISNYLPDIEILYMTPLANAEYFSKLLFIKIAYKLELPISAEKLKLDFNVAIDDEHLAILADWINCQTYPIWSTELGELWFLLKNNKDLNSLKHSPDPMMFVRKYMYSMHLSYFNTCQHIEDKFNKVHVINSDSLSIDGVEFWNNVHKFIPDLDMDFALEKTAEWILRNNALTEKFNNDNNL